MSTAEATLNISQEWSPSANPWLIALSVMLATFMVVLDTSVANVALPHMAGTFSATSDEATWILTSYLIATGIILPSTAWFSSFFGRKGFLIICIILFTIASACCGLATNLDMMLVARVFQGLGGGALIPISQAILLESFPREKRGISMAIFGFGVVLAPVIGPSLGGWITDNFNWSWIFFINIPIGIIATIMCSIFLEDPPYIKKGTIQKIDYIGFIALIVWLVTLQLVLDNGQKMNWLESSWIRWNAITSLIAMTFFFVWETHFEDSIIDLKVFKDINFTIGTILSAVVNAVLYATLAMLPLFLETLLGYTAYDSGMAITPRGMGCILTIALAGYLSSKIDNRLIILVGLFLLGLSCFMFGDLNLTISMYNIIFPNIICGFALGLIFIPLATLSFNTLNNAQIGNATGLQNLLKNIGGAIGVSLVSTLLSRNAQIHQANMVSHLNVYNHVFQAKFTAIKHALSIYMSPVVASHKANYFLYGSLREQAGLWAYIDNFRFFGMLSLLLIPAVFLFSKIKVGPKESQDVVIH